MNQRHALWNTLIFISMPLLGMIFSFLGFATVKQALNVYLAVAIAFYIAGLFFFLKAKLTLRDQKNFLFSLALMSVPVQNSSCSLCSLVLS